MLASERRTWTILCDFDGTISLDDATDVLLERFARPGWEELELAWKANRIGSRECMAGQVALIDTDRAALDQEIDALRLDATFPAFVKLARAHGHNLLVVSDGIDYSIERCLARWNFEPRIPVIANQLEGSGPRDWRLAFPYTSLTCVSGTCKCTASLNHASRQPVLLIGDGTSDFCVAGTADAVFAKGRLADYCLANGIAHRRITGFDDALSELRSLEFNFTPAQISSPLTA